MLLERIYNIYYNREYVSYTCFLHMSHVFALRMDKQLIKGSLLFREFPWIER